ncbi:MAG: PAS domain-containing protein [Micropepsaceae bacterium]
MTAEKGTVTAAEIMRNFGYWQQQALTRPLIVTHHGRARVMLISTDHYEDITASGFPPALGDQSDLLSEVLDHSSEGFAVHDRDFRILRMNRTALAWLGVSAGDIIGKTTHEFLNRRHSAVFDSMVQRVFRTGEAVSYELAGAGLRARPLRVHSFPFGENVGSAFVDITEEETLAESAAVLEAEQIALELLGLAATVEIDANGRIAGANGVLAQMTGLHAADLDGSMIGDLFEPDSGAAVRETISSVIADSRSRAVPAVLRIGNRSRREVSVSIAPLKRGMAVNGVIAVITARMAQGRAVFPAEGTEKV